MSYIVQIRNTTLTGVDHGAEIDDLSKLHVILRTRLGKKLLRFLLFFHQLGIAFEDTPGITERNQENQ